MQTFQHDDNALYKISTALKESRCLDASQDEDHANQLILYDWNNGPNQKWAIRHVGNGRYAFFNSLNNGVIQVPFGSKKEGEKIIAGKPGKSLNQFWELVPADSSQFGGKEAFYFRNFCGQSLDVYEQKAKNQQPVIQWSHTGGKNQVWLIQKVE